MQFSVIPGAIRWLFLAHALMGAVALFTFLIPILTRKGGRVHVRVGWVYSVAMIFVSVSALAILPWRMAVDPSRSVSSQTFAAFLGFVALFTLASLNHGLRALRRKQRTEGSREWIDLGPPALVILAGLATQFAGLHYGSRLLLFFPFLGYGVSVQQLAYWGRAPREPKHWWLAHMEGMFVACIATVTAFLVTAMPRLVSGFPSDSLWLWIAPGAVLGTASNRWSAYYRKKFTA